MVLDSLFKMQKLKITEIKTTPGPADEFEVMFNPESFSMSHKNVFQKCQGAGTTGGPGSYLHSPPEKLSLELVIDGTGVGDLGLVSLVGLGIDSVSEQIDKFKALCSKMDGKIHRPKLVKLEWGAGPLKDFKCQLESVDIKYTTFDSDGSPLRAELSTVFVKQLEPEERAREEGKESPDLTHKRIVKGGDTLPLLSKEIYGSSKYYLRLAKINGLNDFRNLTPGREIHFPPLEA